MRKSSRGFAPAPPSRVPARLAEKIQVTPDGCWLWLGARTNGARVRWGGALASPQRLLYELLVGPIPGGRVLRPVTCGRDDCVNPEHRAPVSREEQLRLWQQRGCDAGRKTECPRGHEYTPENTLERRQGRRRVRRCRTCESARLRAYRQRKKLAEAKAAGQRVSSG